MAKIDPVTVASRRSLLDALEVLRPFNDHLILCGAQAIYLRTRADDLPIAPYTRDADLALEVTHLPHRPLIQDLLESAGFVGRGQPGIHWRESDGAQIDILVAETQAGKPSRRSADLGPQGKRIARRTVGLEGVLVDNNPMEIASLDPIDKRTTTLQVAGPAALIVAKIHKIRDHRLQDRAIADKDGTDVYRLLRSVDHSDLLVRFSGLMEASISASVALQAAVDLRLMFGYEDGFGTDMVVRNLAFLRDEENTRLSVATLASEFFAALDR